MPGNPLKTRLRTFVNYLLRFVLAGVFLYASYDKLLHPDVFAERIVDYQLVPYPIVNLLAVFIPILEIALAVLLIAGVWTRASALLSLVLLSLFIFAISFAIARGIPLYGCGCFFTTAVIEPVSWLSMWREALLILCALFLYLIALAESISSASALAVNSKIG